LFFVQIGHLANELSTLNRLLLLVSQSSGTTELERSARNSQALLLIRLSSGKLFEGWRMLQRDYFGSKLSKEYDSLLDERVRTALARLSAIFNKNNLIEDIRENFAFHNSSDDVKNQLTHIKDPGTLYIYLGNAHGNSFYSFADVLVRSAMLGKVQEIDF
jgi:hypothetical protein